MRASPRDIGTFLLVLVILAFVTWFGAAGKPTEMGIAIVGVSIALAFVNLERLESFKGAGFEAKMRKAVDEAYATLDTLRQVAKAATITNIDMVSWSNRVGGLSISDKLSHVNAAIEVCDKLGIRDKDVQIHIDDLTRMITWDYVYTVHYAIHKSIANPTKDFDILLDTSNRSGNNYPDVSQIRALLNGQQQRYPELVEETIRDYEHFRDKQVPREGSDTRVPR